MAKTQKKREPESKTALEVALENISREDWAIYTRIKTLIEKARKAQEEQPDGTTVRVGKLVFMRGNGSMRATPDMEKIWSVLDKEEYAPKKPVKGSLRIDFLE